MGASSNREDATFATSKRGFDSLCFHYGVIVKREDAAFA